ncbi:MAG: cupin [Xanthobacteraceae bacterium]
MAKALDERDVARASKHTSTFRAEDVAAAAEFRKEYEKRANVISAEEMPFERSADGLIKHLIHHKMNTPEMCVEAYMQFLKPGEHSGKHRHMWEEVIFVIEGSGYDLHWDFRFDCLEEFEWKWEDEPKRFEWKRGDFIYVPPFVTHQHFADPGGEARLIVISNRIIKEMGFDWFDQLEKAPGA